ncbi:unnamed protein product [Closterium sp. Yama58-4]|nr:unnamed protein product [Closterium sp. Yama58-4]
MERRASLLCRLLLCVTVCTAYGATATSFLSLLPRDSGSSAASTAQATPTVWQGKTIMKYVAIMHPTKVNGKVVGDKGASGRMEFKAVRFSATSYRFIYKLRLFNLKGGETPWMDFAPTCFTTLRYNSEATNITSPKDARRKRYSFIYDFVGHVGTEADARANVWSLVSSTHAIVGRTGMQYALCGKVVIKKE